MWTLSIWFAIAEMARTLLCSYDFLWQYNLLKCYKTLSHTETICVRGGMFAGNRDFQANFTAVSPLLCLMRRKLEGISAAELRLRLMGLYLSSERWISRMWRVYHRELRTHCLSRSVCLLSWHNVWLSSFVPFTSLGYTQPSGSFSGTNPETGGLWVWTSMTAHSYCLHFFAMAWGQLSFIDLERRVQVSDSRQHKKHCIQYQTNTRLDLQHLSEELKELKKNKSLKNLIVCAEGQSPPAVHM